ncbi:uncharacterized protein ACIQIH_011412 [Cyanocitta cristata]
MERQAKETLLRFPYIPKKEARTVAWSNLKFISHLYLQSCKLLEHLCYTTQENYLNKAVRAHVWNVCRQTNSMSVIPFPSALWSWIHVTRLLMLCPVHLNPPETEILQVLLNADCCNALKDHHIWEAFPSKTIHLKSTSLQNDDTDLLEGGSVEADLDARDRAGGISL